MGVVTRFFCCCYILISPINGGESIPFSGNVKGFGNPAFSTALYCKFNMTGSKIVEDVDMIHYLLSQAFCDVGGG